MVVFSSRPNDSFNVFLCFTTNIPTFVTIIMTCSISKMYLQFFIIMIITYSSVLNIDQTIQTKHAIQLSAIIYT